jgi:hypothetical protein
MVNYQINIFPAPEMRSSAKNSRTFAANPYIFYYIKPLPIWHSPICSRLLPPPNVSLTRVLQKRIQYVDRIEVDNISMGGTRLDTYGPDKGRE